MHEWTFAHFPVRKHGEWREMVQRDGSVPKHAKDQPPKMHTCFHLPRTLMMCIDVLQRLSGSSPGVEQESASSKAKQERSEHRGVMPQGVW